MTAYELRGPGGTITISSSALAQVVIHAVERTDGARVRRGRRGLALAITDGRARVELELTARYGAVLPGVAREVQERVGDALRAMCGLGVEAVDVSVEELEG